MCGTNTLCVCGAASADLPFEAINQCGSDPSSSSALLYGEVDAGSCAPESVSQPEANEGGYCSTDPASSTILGFFTSLPGTQLFTQPTAIYASPNMDDPESIVAYLNDRLAAVERQLDAGDAVQAKETYREAFKVFKVAYKNFKTDERILDPQLTRRIFFLRAATKQATGHSSAFKHTSYAIDFMNGQIQNDPNDAEAYLYRARLHHMLGHYEEAFYDYGMAAQLEPSFRAEADAYPCRLEEIRTELTIQRKLAETSGNRADTVLLLSQEIEVFRLLGDEAAARELSPLLMSYTQDFSLEVVINETATLADNGFLTEENTHAYAAYVIFHSDLVHMHSMSMTPEFDVLEDRDKLRILGELQQIGLIAMNRSRLETAQANGDTARTLFYQSRLALIEDNNIPQARLYMMDFKTATESTDDPELLAMREVVRAELRDYTLIALDRLDEANGSLLTQRLGRMELNYYDKKTAQANSGLIGLLRQAVESGHADTLDEAMSYLQSEHQRLQEQFATNPVVQRGWDVNLIYEAPSYGSTQDKEERSVALTFLRDWFADTSATHPEVTNVTVSGGMLRTSSGRNQPRIVRVSIGSEGGIIRTDTHKAYYFPPAEGERVVLIERDGGVRIHSSMQLNRDYQILRHRDDIQKEFGKLTAAGNVSHAENPLRYEGLFGQYGHWTNIGVRDKDFLTLYSLETREGLEAMKTPDGKRKHLLSVAQQVRHRNGSYAVAGQILEQLFAEPLQEALAVIPDTVSQDVRDAVEGDRNDFHSKVMDSLAEAKEANPSQYAERFPSGQPTEAEIEQMVDVSVELEIERRLHKIAFASLQADYESGEMRVNDPIAADAWAIYEDMKDPLDQFWNLSDDSIDAIVDEVVITAVTLPLAMGAGQLVRVGVGSALKLSAQTGVRRFGAGFVTVWAGSATEGLMIEGTSSLLQQRDFSWKNAGFATIMSRAFHCGHLGWKVVNPKVARFLRMNPEGRVFNFAGELSTQTSVATAMTYAGDIVMDHDSPYTFSERLAGETIRNLLGMHYGRWVNNQVRSGGYSKTEQVIWKRTQQIKEDVSIKDGGDSPEVTVVDRPKPIVETAAPDEVTFVEGKVVKPMAPAAPESLKPAEVTKVEGKVAKTPPSSGADEVTKAEGKIVEPVPASTEDVTFAEGKGNKKQVAANDAPPPPDPSRSGTSETAVTLSEKLAEIPTLKLQQAAGDWRRDANAFNDYFADPEIRAELERVVKMTPEALKQETNWTPEQVADYQLEARTFLGQVKKTESWGQRMRELTRLDESSPEFMKQDAALAQEIFSELSAMDLSAIQHRGIGEAVRRMQAGEMPLDVPTLLEAYISTRLRPSLYNQVDIRYMNSLQFARRAAEPMDVFLIGHSLRSKGGVEFEWNYRPIQEIHGSVDPANPAKSFLWLSPESFLGVDVFVKNPAELTGLIEGIKAQGYYVFQTTQNGRPVLMVDFPVNSRVRKIRPELRRMELTLEIHLEAGELPAEMAVGQ